MFVRNVLSFLSNVISISYKGDVVMGFTNLWPLFLLITIPLLVLLYILKRKYREEVISSTLLWNEVYKNTRANTPW